MSDAWGGSWGTSWGSSWGESVTQQITSTETIQKPVDYALAGEQHRVMDGGKLPMSLRKKIFRL